MFPPRLMTLSVICWLIINTDWMDAYHHVLKVIAKMVRLFVVDTYLYDPSQALHDGCPQICDNQIVLLAC